MFILTKSNKTLINCDFVHEFKIDFEQKPCVCGKEYKNIRCKIIAYFDNKTIDLVVGESKPFREGTEDNIKQDFVNDMKEVFNQIINFVSSGNGVLRLSEIVQKK